MSGKAFLRLNILLSVFIVLFLFLNYSRSDVVIRGEYDSRPNRLFEVITDGFPGKVIAQDVSLIIIFNELPTKADIETIEKLHYKLGNRINLVTLFAKKFRRDRMLTFPHTFLTKYKIICENRGSLLDKNFYLITKNRQIKDFDYYLDMRTIFFSIKKQLEPHLDYSDFVVPVDRLKAGITDKTGNNSFKLLNLASREVEELKFPGEYSKIYFFHAKCSPCRLRDFVNKTRLENTFQDKQKSIFIFSVLTDRFELSDLLAGISLKTPIYMDLYDQFNLFSVITDEKANPFIISLNKEDGG